MIPQLIALTGFKHTGKTVAAKYLESKGYVRHNFKDALITELKERFPDLLKDILKVYVREDMVNVFTIDDLFNYKPPLMRALMVNHGTEVRRRENPDYWVNNWMFTVAKENYPFKQNIVTDDVRFLNEAKAVKDAGGTIIRLVRPDITTGGEHTSETEQLQIVADYTIELIPGDKEALYKELDAIIK